jgi:cytochrome c-type biogenesis protein CcmF
MILWLWIGGGVMALGTILALAPKLRRRPRAAIPVAEPTPADELEEVPV